MLVRRPHIWCLGYCVDIAGKCKEKYRKNNKGAAASMIYLIINATAPFCVKEIYFHLGLIEEFQLYIIMFLYGVIYIIIWS